MERRTPRPSKPKKPSSQACIMLKLDPGFLAIWDRLMSKDAMTRSEGIRSAMRMYMRDRSGLTFHDSAKELDVAGDLDA